MLQVSGDQSRCYSKLKTDCRSEVSHPIPNLVGSEEEKTYFRTSDKDGKGMVEIRFTLSGALSLSDYSLRLMKPLRGQNASPPFLSRLCLLFIPNLENQIFIL